MIVFCVIFTIGGTKFQMAYVVEDISNEDKGSSEFVQNLFYSPTKKQLQKTVERRSISTHRFSAQFNPNIQDIHEAGDYPNSDSDSDLEGENLDK